MFGIHFIVFMNVASNVQVMAPERPQEKSTTKAYTLDLKETRKETHFSRMCTCSISLIVKYQIISTAHLQIFVPMTWQPTSGANRPTD